MTADKKTLDTIRELTDKVKELSDALDGNDLEDKYEPPEEKKRSQMLDIDPENVDSFGDAIELATKTRLQSYGESFKVARNFVIREYHNMIGDRYGKHSKLIPVFDETTGKENKIDMVWFSGNDVKIVEIGGKVYYKIRMLVRDILTKKLLLMRIPINNGAARTEEIQHIGAGRMGNQWIQDNAPLNPMKPINYAPPKKNNTMKQVGEASFE